MIEATPNRKVFDATINTHELAFEAIDGVSDEVRKALGVLSVQPGSAFQVKQGNEIFGYLICIPADLDQATLQGPDNWMISGRVIDYENARLGATNFMGKIIFDTTGRAIGAEISTISNETVSSAQHQGRGKRRLLTIGKFCKSRFNATKIESDISFARDKERSFGEQTWQSLVKEGFAEAPNEKHARYQLILSAI